MRPNRNTHTEQNGGDAARKAPLSTSVASQSDLDAVQAFEAAACKGLRNPRPRGRHLLEMHSTSSRYLVCRRGDHEIVGSAILHGFSDPDLRVQLEHFVFEDPEGPIATLVLGELVRWVFEITEANRIEVRVVARDERARSSFRLVGFLVEGVLREFHRLDDGTFVSMWMMSILRKDWTAGEFGFDGRDKHPSNSSQVSRGGIL